MAIKIQIDPGAFGPTGPLLAFAAKQSPALAQTLSYPAVPQSITAAEGTGFIASCSPLTHRTNINEDGTFPTAPSATADASGEVVVHISPTSGSTIIRGNTYQPGSVEFDPAYGLNVTLAGLTLTEDVFETAVQEPIGAQFKANLQDLVAREIIQVLVSGTPLTPKEIGDYAAP